MDRDIVVRVKHDPPVSRFIFKERAVHADQPRLLQQGVIGVFNPLTPNICRRGTSNPVKRALVTVSRIRKVVYPAVFDHEGSFINLGHTLPIPAIHGYKDASSLFQGHNRSNSATQIFNPSLKRSKNKGVPSSSMNNELSIVFPLPAWVFLFA